jgi:hypothetical protein
MKSSSLPQMMFRKLFFVAGISSRTTLNFPEIAFEALATSLFLTTLAMSDEKPAQARRANAQPISPFVEAFLTARIGRIELPSPDKRFRERPDRLRTRPQCEETLMAATIKNYRPWTRILSPSTFRDLHSD